MSSETPDTPESGLQETMPLPGAEPTLEQAIIQDHHLENELAKRLQARVRLNSSFSLSPLIPANPSKKPIIFYGRTFTEPRKQVTIRVGCVDKNGGGPCPGLHIDLWHLILVLFTFWQERPNLSEFKIYPTFNKIWQRLNYTNTHPSKNDLIRFGRLLDELGRLWMEVEIQGEKVRWEDVVHTATKRVTFNFNKKTGVDSKVFDYFEFHPLFVNCLLYAERTQDVRLDVLAGLYSKFCRAAYLWIPARATHFEHDRPAKDPAASTPEYLGKMAVYTSAELFKALGEPNLPVSKRKERLTRGGENSILAKLHGLPLMNQYIRMGVCWWPAEDELNIGTYVYHSDDWVPGPTVSAFNDVGRLSAGDLYRNFIDGGGASKAYTKLLSKWKTVIIEDKALERLGELGVKKIEEYLPLYKQAICILGPDEFRDSVGRLGEELHKARKDDPGYLFRGILFGRVLDLARKRTEQVA